MNLSFYNHLPKKEIVATIADQIRAKEIEHFLHVLEYEMFEDTDQFFPANEVDETRKSLNVHIGRSRQMIINLREVLNQANALPDDPEPPESPEEVPPS